MTQIKIFNATEDADELQDAINEFIKDKEVVKVSIKTLSFCMMLMYTGVVLYKQKETDTNDSAVL